MIVVAELPPRVFGRASSELTEADSDAEADDLCLVVAGGGGGGASSLVGLSLLFRTSTEPPGLLLAELRLRTSSTRSFSNFCSAFFRLCAMRPACKLCWMRTFGCVGVPAPAPPPGCECVCQNANADGVVGGGGCCPGVEDEKDACRGGGSGGGSGEEEFVFGRGGKA